MPRPCAIVSANAADVSALETPPAPFITELSPMLLAEPKRLPVDESEYISEIKYDGYRSLAQCGVGPVVLRTRQGVDCTAWFPEIADVLSQLRPRRGHIIFDGEIAVLDQVGRTDFDALQGRARRKRWSPGDPAVTFCLFDLLVLNGRSVMAERLVDRKARLEKLLADAALPFLLYARHVDAGMVEKPVSWMYAHALALQLEGVVGKRSDSIYLPAQRTGYWFKWKRPGAVPPERFKHKRSR